MIDILGEERLTGILGKHENRAGSKPQGDGFRGEVGRLGPRSNNTVGRKDREAADRKVKTQEASHHFHVQSVLKLIVD